MLRWRRGIGGTACMQRVPPPLRRCPGTRGGPVARLAPEVRGQTLLDVSLVVPLAVFHPPYPTALRGTRVFAARGSRRGAARVKTANKRGVRNTLSHTHKLQTTHTHTPTGKGSSEQPIIHRSMTYPPPPPCNRSPVEGVATWWGWDSPPPLVAEGVLCLHRWG